MKNVSARNTLNFALGVALAPTVNAQDVLPHPAEPKALDEAESKVPAND